MGANGRYSSTGESTQVDKTRKASIAVLVACMFAHFLNHVYTGALSPFLSEIMADLSLSLTEVGIATSAVVVTMTACHIIVGPLGDRGLRDVFIPASVLLSAIAVLFTSLATGLWILVAAQVLLGLGVSPYHPSAFPTLSERFPEEERAQAVGLQAAGGLVGVAVTPFLGSALMVVLGGWRPSLVVLGMLGLVVFVPTLYLMVFSRRSRVAPQVPPGAADGHTDSETSGSVWTRDFVLVLLVTGLRGIPFRCTTLLMPLYLTLRYGYEPLSSGILATIMLTAGLVGELVFARVSDRVGKRVPFIVMSMLLLAPCLLLLNLSLDLPALIVVLVGIGFTYFAGVPASQAYQTEISPPHARGLAFGVLFSIGAVPGALAPWLFGLIGDTYGLAASIIFLVVTSFAGGVAATFLTERPVNGPAATDVCTEPL